MKKILSILGTITLIGTSTTSLVACKPQYSEEQLKELKEENKININGNTLEWIAPQEKPFNTADNKWYFVIWRGNESHDWNITKFKNNEKIGQYNHTYRVIEENNEYKVRLVRYFNVVDLSVLESSISTAWPWKTDKGRRLKSVYRWDGDGGEPDKLVIDPKTGKFTE